MSTPARITLCPKGPEISRLVQGYWRLSEWRMSDQELLTFVKQHVELGITTVDHAAIYGPPPCEALFGKALALQPSLRDELEIVSKFGIVPGDNHKVWHYDARPHKIVESVDQSLARLGVEYLDILLVHRPDYLLNADEVAECFEQLKQAGKVKHFGVSNFTKAQFELLQSRLNFPLVTNQVELNPLNLPLLESGDLEFLQQHHITPMAWSCLAGGRIFHEQSEQINRLRTCLQQVANETGAGSIDEVVYAWVAKLPCNPVLIVGSGNIERVKVAVAALSLELTHEQWYRILTASQGHKVK